MAVNLTRPKTATEHQRKLKALNKDINGMLHVLASYKKHPETERTFFTKEKCEKELALAYHQKLKLLYPKAEALYQSTITETCNGEFGLKLLIKYDLIETCGVADNGEKLYAI